MSLLLDALRKAEKSKSAKLATGKSGNRRVFRLGSAAASPESSTLDFQLADILEATTDDGDCAKDTLAPETPVSHRQQLEASASTEVDPRPNRQSRQPSPDPKLCRSLAEPDTVRSIFDMNNRALGWRRMRLTVFAAATALIAFLLSYYGWFLYAALVPSSTLTSRPAAWSAAASSPTSRPSFLRQGESASVTATSSSVAGPDTPDSPSEAQPPANPDVAGDGAGEPVGENSVTWTSAVRPRGSVPPETAPKAGAQDDETPFVGAVTVAENRVARGGSAERSDIAFSRGRPRASVFPRLDQAYAAYRAGDYAKAESDYRFVLTQEPDNRDALLGMAALALIRGQADEAWGLYRRILELNPRDRVALASLMAIQEDIKPLEAERLLRQLLVDAPDAAYLHAALGNLYAAEERWPLAQQAYFEAYHHETDNGDYAYNLAVALDHMGQGQVALRYYRIALDMAEREAVAFEEEAVRRRVRMLAHGPGSGVP